MITPRIIKTPRVPVITAQVVSDWFDIKRGPRPSEEDCEALAQTVMRCVAQRGKVGPLQRSIKDQHKVRRRHRELTAAIRTVTRFCSNAIVITQKNLPALEEIDPTNESRLDLAERWQNDIKLWKQTIEIMSSLTNSSDPFPESVDTEFAICVSSLAMDALVYLRACGRKIHYISAASPLTRFVQRALTYIEGVEIGSLDTLASIIERDRYVDYLLKNGGRNLTKQK